MIKRYRLNGACEFSVGDNLINKTSMDETDQGEWVKWEDADILLSQNQKLDIENIRLKKRVDRITKIGFGRTKCGACGADLAKGNHFSDCYLITPCKEPKPELKCNCAEKLKEHDSLMDNYIRFVMHTPYPVSSECCPKVSWLCPLHGYKKR